MVMVNGDEFGLVLSLVVVDLFPPLTYPPPPLVLSLPFPYPLTPSVRTHSPPHPSFPPPFTLTLSTLLPHLSLTLTCLSLPPLILLPLTHPPSPLLSLPLLTSHLSLRYLHAISLSITLSPCPIFICFPYVSSLSIISYLLPLRHSSPLLHFIRFSLLHICYFLFIYVFVLVSFSFSSSLPLLPFPFLHFSHPPLSSSLTPFPLSSTFPSHAFLPSRYLLSSSFPLLFD